MECSCSARLQSGNRCSCYGRRTNGERSGNLRRRADDEDDDGAGEPFEYSGEHLAACNFPLGSFGTGRILLCGDGTMKEWTVVNQVRTDDGGPGDILLVVSECVCTRDESGAWSPPL